MPHLHGFVVPGLELRDLARVRLERRPGALGRSGARLDGALGVRCGRRRLDRLEPLVDSREHQRGAADVRLLALAARVVAKPARGDEPRRQAPLVHRGSAASAGARVVQQATTQQPSTLLCGGVDHEAIGAKGGQDSSVQRLVVLKRPLLRDVEADPARWQRRRR